MNDVNPIYCVFQEQLVESQKQAHSSELQAKKEHDLGRQVLAQNEQLMQQNSSLSAELLEVKMKMTEVGENFFHLYNLVAFAWFVVHMYVTVFCYLQPPSILLNWGNSNFLSLFSSFISSNIQSSPVWNQIVSQSVSICK